MAKVDIVYITSGGNTKLVCQVVADIVSAAGHTVYLQHVREANPDAAVHSDALILACPTYGHGLLDARMEHFMRQLEQHSDQLNGLPAAAIGLGDTLYDTDYHIESGKILHSFLQENGAKLLSQPLLLAGSPVGQLETVVQRWAESLVKALEQ